MNNSIMLRIAALFVTILCLQAGVLSNDSTAQNISTPWLTLETAHFRVHYDARFNEWVSTIADRLEPYYREISSFVGYDHDRKTDVVVVDPLGIPNGAALPFLKRPRMILFTTPPGADSSIGYYNRWQDLLFIHELGHVLHLTRRPHNMTERVLSRLLLRGPLERKLPAWVVEGYATLIEGKLTGFGRPNGSVRAMFIRNLAMHGMLPRYDELDGSDRFGSGADRYLIGSAFLEWLEKRQGDGSLIDLWKRMTAKKRRSFEQAFKGVFQAPPDELYGEFLTETIGESYLLQKRVKRTKKIQEGKLWVRHEHFLGIPDLSPDGSLMAITVREKDSPPRLEIWSTTKTADEAESDKEEKSEQDPYDVPDKPWKPAEREVMYSLHTINDAPLLHPRFIKGESAILGYRFLEDAYGFFSPDLFVWNYERGGLRRVTYHKSLRDAVPFHSQKKAIAIQSRFGMTNLVMVDLSNGDVTPFLESGPERVFCYPSISPDDRRLAVVTHKDKSWGLEVYDIRSGKLIVRIGNGLEVITFPRWAKDSDTLVYATDRSGINSIESFTISSGKRRVLTNTLTGAFAPLLDKKEENLYYLVFWAKGINIHKMPVSLTRTLGTSSMERYHGPVPILPPESRNFPKEIAAEPAGAAHNYGWGKQEFSFVGAAGVSQYESSTLLGARFGDIIGRNETLLLISPAGNAGSSGGTIRQSIKRFPIRITFQPFYSRYFPAKLKNTEPGYGMSRSPFSERGAAITLSYGKTGTVVDLMSNAAILFEEYAFDKTSQRTRSNVGSLQLGSNIKYSRDNFRLRTTFYGRMEAGSTEGSSWNRLRGKVESTIAFTKGLGVALSYEGGVLHQSFSDWEMFSVGGWESPTNPEVNGANTIENPLVPRDFMRGEEFHLVTAALQLGNTIPLNIKYWQLSVSRDEMEETNLSAMFLEWEFSVPSIGLLNFAGVRFRAGAGKTLEGPTKDELKAYVMLLIPQL